MTESGWITQAVAESLDDAQLLPRDSGGAALALRYAQAVDADPDKLADLGPKLLAVLTSLGMTPAGRGAKGGGDSAPVVSKLDELRDRRAARANRAQAGN